MKWMQRSTIYMLMSLKGLVQTLIILIYVLIMNITVKITDEL